jgi:hypothetical protein
MLLHLLEVRLLEIRSAAATAGRDLRSAGGGTDGARHPHQIDVQARDEQSAERHTSMVHPRRASGESCLSHWLPRARIAATPLDGSAGSRHRGAMTTLVLVARLHVDLQRVISMGCPTSRI